MVCSLDGERRWERSPLCASYICELAVFDRRVAIAGSEFRPEPHVVAPVTGETPKIARAPQDDPRVQSASTTAVPCHGGVQ
jgi:hypothetical protein